MTSIKKILLFIFIAFSILNAKAQIEEEIISFTDSTAMLVLNGRQLFTQSLRYSDIEKAQEIYIFLSSETENNEANTHAFYYNEELAVQVLFQEWDTFLKMAANYNPTEEWLCYSFPVRELSTILDAINSNNTFIEFGMDNTSLSNEDTDILQLYYHLVKTREADEIYSQKYKQFKEQYPHSKYNIFLEQFLLKPRIKAHLSFSVGPNYIYPSLGIEEHFEPNMGITIDLSFNIKRLLFSLYVSSASLHSKYAFSASYKSHQFEFNNHEAFTYTELGGLFGYSILQNNHFRITPFIPLAVSSIQSNHFKGDRIKDEYQVFKSFTSGIGLNSELKIWQFKLKDKYTDTKSFLSIKLQLGYNNIFDSPNRHIFYFRTGLVWGFGDF